MRVQKYTTPNTILQISVIPKWAPTQKNHDCRFKKVGVPVPELDNQCQNWNGAEMGSNIDTNFLGQTVRNAWLKKGYEWF
jgi:hypothetical protein